MTEEKLETHDFLLNTDGELRKSAKKLPRIREYINGLPESASTFRLKELDDVYQPNFKDVHMEFCKSWRMHEIYEPTNKRVYVNPNHYHAHAYSDIVVECECGAVFTRNYDTGNGSLQSEHDHSEDCLPHHRLMARAQITRRRYGLMNRLGRLGWKGTDMAPRFGAQESMMGALAGQFNTSLHDIFNEYRRIAGNTYVHLVWEKDESSILVSDVYGHSRSTMTRWAHEYADVDYDGYLDSGGDDDKL